MTITIPITHKRKGTHLMYIDDEDLDKIKDLNITLNHTSNRHTYYAKSRIYKNKKFVKDLNIHRVIMGLGDYKDDKRIINHIDGNGLNNCKSNLEICDTMYNSQSFRQHNRVCKYYSFENDPKRKCKWRAMITINKKRHSKRFMTEQECIKWIDDIIEEYIN